MFNSCSRQPNESAKYVRHIKDRETTLSVYLGLSLHAQTRKRDLVDSFHKQFAVDLKKIMLLVQFN